MRTRRQLLPQHPDLLSRHHCRPSTHPVMTLMKQRHRSPLCQVLRPDTPIHPHRLNLLRMWHAIDEAIPDLFCGCFDQPEPVMLQPRGRECFRRLQVQQVYRQVPPVARPPRSNVFLDAGQGPPLRMTVVRCRVSKVLHCCVSCRLAQSIQKRRKAAAAWVIARTTSSPIRPPAEPAWSASCMVSTVCKVVCH